MRIAAEKKRSILPVRLIALSFALVIIVGTLLLCLPISSGDRNFTHPLDALFTATSATCVTGLVLFDTLAKWSAFGQAVILVLIQLGGIGLISLSTFFTLLIRRRLGIKELQLASEYISGGDIKDIPRIMRLIVLFTFGTELLGALILCIRFVPSMGAHGVWVSVFLAVSAFCNAGFDILGQHPAGGNLMPLSNDPLVILTISALIIIGGIGFLVVHDVLFSKRGQNLLHTRVALIFTAVLLLTGTAGFLAAEYHNPLTLGPMPLGGKILNAFFQSVTCRTAGFNSISIIGLNAPSKLLSCVLMFIGAAPASTGGGIKVTTFVVLIMTVVSVVRGRQDTVMFGHRIDKNVVYRAFAIAMLAFALVVTAFLIVFYSQQNIPALDCLIEVVSAFGTVGLTAALSPLLTPLSKIVVIFTMFVGRVGPVSLALALTVRGAGRAQEVLPEGRILVG